MHRRGTSAIRAFRDDLLELVAGVSSSVVTIRVGTQDLSRGTGSGWFFAPGVIVTNHHVVAGERPSLKVRLKGGRVVPGQLVGSDARTDLAVVRVDSSPNQPLTLRADPPPLGELCYAFGSPLGEYTESVTHGIVSGLERRMPLDNGFSIENLLQIDAEINPGNSGGPLVDIDGQVMGVNVMIRSDGRGMGFAVPARTAAMIIPELIEYGEIVRPRLGVSLEVIGHSENGVEGERLRVANAPADNPLSAGDVLLAIDQTEIRSRANLFEVLHRDLLDTEVPVAVSRNGDEIRVPVRFQAEHP